MRSAMTPSKIGRANRSRVSSPGLVTLPARHRGLVMWSGGGTSPVTVPPCSSGSIPESATCGLMTGGFPDTLMTDTSTSTFRQYRPDRPGRDGRAAP